MARGGKISRERRKEKKCRWRKETRDRNKTVWYCSFVYTYVCRYRKEGVEVRE